MLAQIAGQGQRLSTLSEPRRLWSLWDMFNFHLGNLCFLLDWLRQQQAVAEARKDVRATPPMSLGVLGTIGVGEPKKDVARALAGLKPQMEEADKTSAKSFVDFAKKIGEEIEASRALARIDRIQKDLDFPYGIEWSAYADHLKVLKEAIEDDCKNKLVYYYSDRKLEMLAGMGVDWKRTDQAFKSARQEMFRAVDCYAMGQPTASVFHLMRLAEHGLRALAKERKVKFPRKPIEWETWQEILSKLKTEIDKVGKWRPGPRKDAALEFYRGAWGEFEAFKDAYRNSVMHTRRNYTDAEAHAVLLRVRDFMERLSSKLSENSTKAIKWGRNR